MSEQETKVVEMHADIHRRAKAEAALDGITLRAFVERAVIREIHDNRRKTEETPQTERL